MDTTSDFAEIVLAVLGVSAKLERRRLLDRTTRGHAAAKARGVKFARKPKLTPHQRKEAWRGRRRDRKPCARSRRATTLAMAPSLAYSESCGYSHYI
ncbi:hypothetical protein [Aureimonas altamirensis]|uniref:hypothetical protein n=1 Tax=Aureimonas altamirensis TaxID=370622 RepID=UPI003D8164F7